MSLHKTIKSNRFSQPFCAQTIGSTDLFFAVTDAKREGILSDAILKIVKTCNSI